MTIGKNIYDLRKEKKLTQGQLAEKLGVSEQAVSKWENGICTPDVSLFPFIANLFGVSIDRIYGYHTDSYAAEVDEIIKEADDSMDTRREIEIISDGLKRYPNSAKLKIYLAFSLSMINRITDDVDERRKAVDKAVSLCNEVVATCGDTEQTDNALTMLHRIFTETGDTESALRAIDKLSADNYYSRITGKASVLLAKKYTDAQLKHVESALYWCWLSMCHITEGLVHGLEHNKKDIGRAYEFNRLRTRLISVFDEGGDNFFATYKMMAAEASSQLCMKLGDKNGCLDSLELFFKLADDVRKVSGSESFNIADRNKYFSDISEKKYLEEYMSEVYPQMVLKKYEAFLSDEARFQRLK